MARQRTPVQVNQFIGGLNTEANPLNFPPTASIDEQNVSINRDGSRVRRNGFDVEEDFQLRDVPIDIQEGVAIGRNQFLWENTGGANNQELLVLQVGNYIAIHDLNNLPLSDTPIATYTFSAETYGNTYGFAVVDGLLVIATGEKEITVLTYDNGVITSDKRSLLIRDLFSVAAKGEGSYFLTDPDNIQHRPTTLTDEHLYNLRNQTFALPRVVQTNSTTLIDPIVKFYDASAAEPNPSFPIDSLFPQPGEPVQTEPRAYPSNADNATKFIFANANHDSDREVERFVATTMYKTLPSSTYAPLGYFVIDALERGRSRELAEQRLRNIHPSLSLSVSSLPQDKTPNGASTIAQYSGRIWYAGFSGELIGGDNQSPRMSSYVLFSQVVQNASDIHLCYQEADPTSIDDPDLADTDGGFIKIDGAYNIKALVPVDNSLFVLAENGVWRIVGLEESTFTATAYSVNRVSEEGCVSATSAVINGKTLAYWGEDAIYGLAQDNVGMWKVSNLTQNSIQTLYDEISEADKSSCVGYYDPEGLSIRWVYGSDIANAEVSNELILDLRFTAFTKNLINLPDSTKGLFTVSGGSVATGEQFLAVTDNTNAVVTADGEDVWVGASSIQRGQTESYYSVITEFGPDIKYTFGRYNRLDTPDDWTRLGDPTDSPAYLLSGSITGGDGRLKKDVPYLTVYFKQPEDLGEASCIFSSRWDWTPNLLAGKWTSPRQIFRKQRFSNDGGILATRNKVRGFGRSVAFSFESEPSTPFHIYGWEFNLEATREE